MCKERHSIWRKDKDKVHSVRNIKVNRQKVKPYYICNGAIFINKKEAITGIGTRFKHPVVLYVMDKVSSLDIHNKEDLELAEFYLKKELTEYPNG